MSGQFRTLAMFESRGFPEKTCSLYKLEFYEVSNQKKKHLNIIKCSMGFKTYIGTNFNRSTFTFRVRILFMVRIDAGVCSILVDILSGDLKPKYYKHSLFMISLV